SAAEPDTQAEPAAEPKDTANLNDATGANIKSIDIALASLGGGDRQLSEWAGKPLVVNFWATWCAPCRKEIPLLKALQDEYAQDELTVIGVAIDEMDAVETYSQDAQFNYPVLVGEESGFRMATAIGVSNLYVPITAFVDRTGEVRRIHTGEIHRDEAEFAISEIVAR
ncbi:MAG: TlpA disulfide reductase family protein, partial [Pseudomonadota bacterium]